MPLSLSIASTVSRLTGGTAMVLPIRSFGVRIGRVARLTTPIGFFWYCAPMITSGAFCVVIALTTVSTVDSATSAFFDSTDASGTTSGPPGRYFSSRPSSLYQPFSIAMK